MTWHPPSFNTGGVCGKGNATANLMRHWREQTSLATREVAMKIQVSVVATVRSAPQIGQGVKAGLLTA
jgi:hypothetical protein